MKKAVLLIGLLIAVSLVLHAGNEKVVGEWKCEAYVDMSYPFTLTIQEEAGKLAGAISGDQGTTQLENVSYQEDKLKFQFNYPEAGGLVDFEAKVEDKKIDGTLGNDMFMGDFSCTPK